MTRYSNLEFILDEFRAGRVVKLKAHCARAEIERIEQTLRAWEPIVMAACAYYDTVVSELPDAAEQHEQLLAIIRASGMVEVCDDAA